MRWFLFLLGTLLPAADTTCVHWTRLVVGVRPGDAEPLVRLQAQTVASRILAQSCILTDWIQGYASASDARHVLVTYAPEPAPSDPALAHARSAEGVEIYFSRIARKMPAPYTHILLGHQLAHEIIHRLTQNERHASSGLMKAQWDDEDLRQMRRDILPVPREIRYRLSASR